MQMIETNIEQRGLLPLPAAALVIDIRGVNDDEVVERLHIEIADLASEMKTHSVHHWRHLTEFLSFTRIMPAQEDRQPVSPIAGDDDVERQGLTGHVHPPKPAITPLYEEDGDLASDGSTPFHLFEQRIEDLVQEIDRIRTNRIAAVADLNKAGIPGRSSRDATVRVIFLTDAERPESLASAALYAERLKEYYRKLERPGHQALINTTILCLSNRGEACPPTKLIKGLMRNNSWQHLDSLILSEDYREDAALIAGIQAYIAELLLYTLLIIPPLGVGSPPDTEATLQHNGQGAPKERQIDLPSNTYVVGLAALEYSARWGQRWVNFGLAKEVIDVLRQKPADSNKEKVRIADTADSWFREWRSRVQGTIPDNAPGDIPALMGVQRARQAADPAQNVFTARNFSFNIGEGTIRDLQEYLSRLAETYVTSTSEPTLQDALMQSTPQIMQALQAKGSKSPAERIVKELGKLQVEAEQILGHPKFFTGATGSAPRARTQLWALGAAISRFQQEHQNNPLNPMSMKDNLRRRREEFEQSGSKMIGNLKKHLESWPFFSCVLHLKQTLAVLTLLIILFLSMVTILLGFAWLHHLLVLKAASALPFVDAALLGVPALEILAWVVVILFLVVECVTFGPRLINEGRSPLNASTPNVRNLPCKTSLKPDARPQEAEAHSAISHWKHIEVEITFGVSLLVFALYGWFINFSIDSLKNLADDPTSIHYLGWLSLVPEWSIIVGIIALLLLGAEIVYFLWWLGHLLQERQCILDDLQAQYQNIIRDVTNFIADDVTMEILQRAELIDDNGGPGGYYFRIAQLCDLLDEVADKAQEQQQLAANRLLLSQNETQQGTGVTSSGGTWLNLHIRDEKLEMDVLTDGYKGLRQKLVSEREELRELAEFLLRAEGVEKVVELRQQFEERPSKINEEQRRLQLFMTALVSIAMRFAIEPLAVRNIEPITEQYKSTHEYARQHIPVLNAFIRALNKRVSQATLQSFTTGNAASNQGSLNTLHNSIVADAVATWGQLFWQSKDRRLEQVLMQDGLLAQLSRLLQGDYDPRAVMRHLLAHTILFGRSQRPNRKGDLYLLLAPSPQSYQFRQGLKSMKLPHIIDFPDIERIILLGVQHYVAEPMFLPEPRAEPGEEEEDGMQHSNAAEPLTDDDTTNVNQTGEDEQNIIDQDTAAAPSTNGSHPGSSENGNNPPTGEEQDDSTRVP